MRNVTIIASSKVEAIALKHGLVAKVKKSETKWYHPAVGIKRSIAIPNTKGGATRIYLVGFEAKLGTCPHPKPPADTVTQMFDHSLPEKELLRAIFAACKSLASSSVTASPAEPTALQQAAMAAADRYVASQAA